MPPFSLAGFTDEYLIDIQELDEQHRTFSIFSKNRCHGIRFYKPLDDDEVDDVIDIMSELREYALLHFRTEESYMQETAYPASPNRSRHTTGSSPMSSAWKPNS